MPVPADERQHFDAIHEERLEKERLRREGSEEVQAAARALRVQARIVHEKCPDLLAHIARRAGRTTPTNATASERSVWRCGILDALGWIEELATEKEPEERAANQRRE